MHIEKKYINKSIHLSFYIKLNDFIVLELI